MRAAARIGGTFSAARAISRRELMSLLIYIGALAAPISTAIAMLWDLADESVLLDEGRAELARFEYTARSPAAHDTAPSDSGASPLLNGVTITIAGAALQARVEAAAKNAGAKILSTQIDLQGPRSAEGFIELNDRLDIHQPDLQAFLYDLEAGAPFLFVDSLEIEAPAGFAVGDGAWMRVELGATGQWQDKP